MRLGVFVDVSNLYYCCQRKYDGGKIDYSAYLRYVEDFGSISIAKAFGGQRGNEAIPFIRSLEMLGFQTYYKNIKYIRRKDQTIQKKCDLDVEIAMDVVRNIDNFDKLILGSGDGDLAALCEWVKEQGKTVLVLGVDVSHELEHVADTLEIPRTLMETR